MKNTNLKQDIISGVMIVFGTVIMGCAFNIFLTPNNISPSGFSGLSAIIATFLSKINIHIPASILYLLLNVVLFIFAFKLVGKKFAIYAMIGILSFSGAMELIDLFNFQVTGDLLVCALYGGIIFGIGTGLVVRYNGSTGGSDMLATIIRSKTTKFSTGQIIFACNLIVLILSVFAYGANSLLYSIITIFLASEITDLVIDGARGVKAFYIITNKKDEITKRIFTDIKRGATEIKINGMYSHEDKIMILCLINKYRSSQLKRIVQDVDPEAFVFSTSVNEVIGKGFYVPEKKVKKQKIVKPTSVIPENVENLQVIDKNIEVIDPNSDVLEQNTNETKNN